MKKPRRAFTLIELLVVGIIALLVSILMPALGKAMMRSVSAGHPGADPAVAGFPKMPRKKTDKFDG